MATKKVVGEAEELPKTIVRRLVKDKLAELSKDGGGEITLLRDALLAFSESARIFIHYLSATANDICKESKRQTINAEDLFKALEEIEFPEFIDPLRASLEEFRRKNAVKRAGSAKAKEGKKSKKEEQPTENEGEEHDSKVNQEDEDENEDEEDGNAHDNTSG